jgi:hypothetical protein
MAGVTANIDLSIQVTQTGTADLGNPVVRASIAETLQLSEGNGALGLADVFFKDTRTLAASATENLDLSGVLVDAFGAIATSAEIVAIYIKAANANTNNVIVGNVTNGFAGPLGATGTYTISPGDYYLAINKGGWAVTNATGDLLKIANSAAGTSVTYDVVIIGRSIVG